MISRLSLVSSDLHDLLLGILEHLLDELALPVYPSDQSLTRVVGKMVSLHEIRHSIRSFGGNRLLLTLFAILAKEQ